MRVLVIEDSNVTRSNLAAALREQHCEVEQACCAEDGLVLLDHATRTRLVLLDYELKNGGGLAVIEAIRKQPALNRVIIVAMISRASLPGLNKLQQAGINDFLQKPVMPLMLCDVIAKYSLNAVGMDI